MHAFSRLSVVLVALLLSIGVSATIRLPWFFSDGMVLQQNTDAAIWGWASPGATVKVSTSWNRASYSTKADADGKWRLTVKTPVAGEVPTTV